jgi:DNA-binding SARP family transcriptional activator/ActR/RegA family two-component response regulator
MTKQLNILVIEDRADWQKLIQRTLEKENLMAHPVASFEEAVEALRTSKFDLAVTDIVLDDTKPRFNRDGLSVISRIQELQAQLPLIILTGFLTQDVSASLSELCPAAPIFKKESFDRTEFLAAIHRLTGEQLSPEPDHLQKPDDALAETVSLPAAPPLAKAVGRPCILLVENRASWQKIVVEVLDKAGYFWRVAADAQEALHLLDQMSFHLIILDLKLQENDLPLRSSEGWLLLDHLVEAGLKSKVVILSGRTRPDDAVKLITRYPIIIDFIEKQNFSGQRIKDAVSKATRVPALRIQTFGQFCLWRDDKRLGVWERPQAETLVKLLLVRRAYKKHTVTTDELITYLWPDSAEESGRKKLLPLISSARHMLEPDIEPRHSNFILRDTNGYYFELNGAVTWDLKQFQEHLRLGQQWLHQEKWAEAIVELEKGRALYRGDFMEEDRYTDWVIYIRREIVKDFRDLLIALADAYAALARYPEAIGACEAALQKDPLLERVYRRLMRLHYYNHEKGQALKVYRDCLKLFEELFGEAPTPATTRLRDAIANDEPVEYKMEVGD